MPMTSDQAAQPPTFAMLMQRIAADSELSDTRRKSLLTSIRCFARLLGRDPARMTVDLGLYSKVIASFRPARHKLTKARWSNICCDLRYVLKYAGVAGVPGRNLTPPSAPWRQPLATVEDRVGRASLARFARWATGDGVEEPMMVTAELLERYHAGLRAHDVNSRGKAAWCRFLQAWNREATTNPAWPKVTLPRARHLNRWTTSLDRLPEPLRRANMAGLRLGTSLTRRGGSWWISLAAAETKTGRPIEVPLPEAVTAPLERYLDQHRPLLLAGGSDDHLWITKDGTWLRPHAVFARVTTLTRARLGVAINPHLFRDCAATSIALDDPAHVLITRDVLGHRTLATSQRHYNQAGSLEAARVWQAQVRRLRGRPETRAQRRKGTW
jgi:hypothetical protein